MHGIEYENKKLKTTGQIVQIVEELRKRSKKTIFTNGCFDILHVGHIRYLQLAKSLGDYLIIGLNSDTSVRRLKGAERPINNQEDRAFLLSALDVVDYIIVFEEDTPYNLIKKIKPDILVKGGDWAADQIVGSDIVKVSGGQVISLPFFNGYSTTGTIERLTQYINEK